MTGKTITVSIKNFKKYNPRSDSKRPTWFRMDHSIFDDSKMFDLSDRELRSWLYLLCQASKAGGGGTLTVNFAHADRIASIPEKDLHRALEIFQERQLLTIHSREGRFMTKSSSPATYDTNVRTLRNDTNVRDEIPLQRPTAAAKVKTAKSSATWDAYSAVYQKRHGAPPIRNAKVSSQLSQFVDRVGIEDAPRIAEFFVWHNDAFYLRSMHQVGLLLRDAEKIRTEWITGKKMLGSTAREVERAQHNADVWQEAAEIVNREIEKKKEAQNGTS